MDLKLKDKRAFITGSTSGIGFATAAALLKEGAEVIINGRGNGSVQNKVQVLRDAFPHGKVSGIAADFDDLDSINALISKLPDLDILVNNVGIYYSKSFYKNTDKEWYQLFEVNVMSGVRLSRNFLPKMINQKWGRIVFISSECAQLVPEDLISYSTTKAALHALSRGLAQSAKGTGVTVNTVAPGSTLTEGAQAFLSNLAESKGTSKEEAELEFFKEIRTSSLLQRFAKVEEVANTITYLCSPLSAATNGSVIKVDGGSMGGIN